jgi:hypothetical protein
LFLFLNQAFERYPVSARAQALAYAYTATATGIDAVRINPAGLSLVKGNLFLVGYEHALSGIEGLHNIGIGFARPLFTGGIGVAMTEFGFEEQREQAGTLAIGMGISQDYRIGIAFDLYAINNARTGYGFSYGLSAGLLGKLYKKWSLGVYGHDLNWPRFGTGPEGEIPARLQAGLGYEPFDGILSEIDISIVESDIRMHFAGEFRLFDVLFFRTGVRTNPQAVAFGTGVMHKYLKIDYGVEYIPDLPLSHIITAGFEF